MKTWKVRFGKVIKRHKQQHNPQNASKSLNIMYGLDNYNNSRSKSCKKSQREKSEMS